MYIYLCPDNRLEYCFGNLPFAPYETAQRYINIIKNGYADPFDPFVNGLTGYTQKTMEVML